MALAAVVDPNKVEAVVMLTKVAVLVMLEAEAATKSKRVGPPAVGYPVVVIAVMDPAAMGFVFDSFRKQCPKMRCLSHVFRLQTLDG